MTTISKNFIQDIIDEVDKKIKISTLQITANIDEQKLFNIVRSAVRGDYHTNPKREIKRVVSIVVTQINESIREFAQIQKNKRS